MFRTIETDQGDAKISLTIDGKVVVAREGEPLAAVLLRVPPFTSRLTPVKGSARAPYCMMGVCFDCLIEIDGVTSIRSCLRGAQEGMAVRRQPSRPDPLKGNEH